MKIFSFIAITAFFMLLTTSSAYAYLDAGTGSIILQLLLGGLAGAAVILKLFWHKILGIFGIKKEGKDETSS